ncbi:hypothetical protein TURU_011237 [Turdus rufiventris]|nr:hypothetical protein TURU_011237 [Turdus rufiventris]
MPTKLLYHSISSTGQAAVVQQFLLFNVISVAISITDLLSFGQSYIANQQKLERINDNEAGFYVGLKNFNLSRNKLSSLSKKPFRHLGLSDLILLGNPFKCSCEIMWIKKFQETKFYRETLDLYCIDDTTKRISLLDMKVPNCGNGYNCYWCDKLLEARNILYLGLFSSPVLQ